MSQRRVQIVILCEDRQQEVFARHFLECRGFPKPFRTKTCPKGSQSGEQYVRNQYLIEVRGYRRNRNRVSIGLVVLIDADLNTVQERFNQLDSALSNDAQQVRQTDEAIAIFTPKRNIETWIHHLQGENVNETDTYSKFQNSEASCKPYVRGLVDQCRSQSLPEAAPESLRAACGEMHRLLTLLEQ